MCPYADLINHNPFANTYIVAERPFKMFNPIRGDEVSLPTHPPTQP